MKHVLVPVPDDTPLQEKDVAVPVEPGATILLGDDPQHEWVVTDVNYVTARSRVEEGNQYRGDAVVMESPSLVVTLRPRAVAD